MTTIPYTISDAARSFLAQKHGMWIGGKHETAHDLEELGVFDPASEVQISNISLGGAAEIEGAVAAARHALSGPWSKMSAPERARVMLAYADRIDQNSRLFTEIAVLDNGMPWVVGESTAPFCASLLRYYSGFPARITGMTMPSAALGLRPDGLMAYTLREPVGVIGAITPWNYSFGMEMLKIAPVLATGCTLVLKTAEQAPLAGLLLAQLALEAGIPEGVLNVVTGLGETAGAALAAHPGVDKIAFTGSTEVGRLIVRAAAGNLKRVSLELGGKSPVIIFPDAKLEAAIPGAALAGFMLQGQNCVCGSRVFVHEAIAKDVVQGMADFSRGMKVGPGFDPANMIGPLISREQRNRVEGLMKSAREQGARLVVGGDRVGSQGFYVAPTIFADTKPDMTIVREEIFGPVIAVQTFGDEDLETIARAANDTIYGLSGSVWTRNLETAHRMVKLIDAGQVGVNCHAAMDPTMPFGGNKQSGWGREFGAESLDLYLKTKAVTITW